MAKLPRENILAHSQFKFIIGSQFLTTVIYFDSNTVSLMKRVSGFKFSVFFQIVSVGIKSRRSTVDEDCKREHFELT